jgi:hypothetical protein
MGNQALDINGRPVEQPAAQPPQSDPDTARMQPPQEAQMARMDASLEKTGRIQGMGESLIGMDMSMSERDPSPNAWNGEIGPGKPANRSGALGMPGQANSPEDVQYNRSRFDTALKQSKGDKFQASMGSGSFPSGNPIAHGTMEHMKRLVETTDGDGVDTNQMDEGTRRRYKADAVKQMEEFGPYVGMDDPDSPPPPVRPLSYSFNPLRNKWTSPEGHDSMLDRFGNGRS